MFLLGLSLRTDAGLELAICYVAQGSLRAMGVRGWLAQGRCVYPDLSRIEENKFRVLSGLEVKSLGIEGHAKSPWGGGLV